MKVRLPLGLATLLLALFILIGGPAGAASISATIQGVVIDEGGRPIPDVVLTLSSPQLLGGPLQRTSGVDGRFRFEGVPPGAFELLAQKQGFGQVRKQGILASVHRSTDTTIAMKSGREELLIIKEVVPPIFELPASWMSWEREGKLLHRFQRDPTWAAVSGKMGVGAPPYADPCLAFDQIHFCRAGATPISSFAIDVGTGAYPLVRGFLASGAAPPRDAVRIEELLNAFPSTDAPPTDDTPFAVHAEVTAAPWAEGHRLVRIGIQGRSGREGDVTIQVELNPAEVSSYRLFGYQNRAPTDLERANDTVHALPARGVTILYEIVPASPPIPSPVVPARYRASRRAKAAARSGELLHVRILSNEGTSPALSVPVRDTGMPFEEASADTRWAAAVAGFGMLLRGSSNQGTLDWEWVTRTAIGAWGEDPPGGRAEFLGVILSARQLFERDDAR